MVGEGVIQRLQIPINQMQCMDFIWILISFLFSWPFPAAFMILVPQPGVGPSAVRTQTPNHWIARGIVHTNWYILIISVPFLPSNLTTSHVRMTSLLFWEHSRPLFFLKKIYWSIVDLQQCVSLKYTAKWVSFACTYILFFSVLCPYRPLQST